MIVEQIYHIQENQLQDAIGLVTSINLPGNISTAYKLDT